MTNSHIFNSSGLAQLPPELESQQGVSAWLQVLFEGHPDMLVVADEHGLIVAVNSAVLSGFGYTRDQLVGQSIGVLVPEAVRNRHAHHVGQFLEHPTPRAMGAGIALKGRHAGGSEFPVDVMLKPFTAGSARYVMGVCRQLDAIAVRSQLQIQALVESVRDYAINLLDAEGRILTWNEGSRRIHGMSATEALGQSISILYLSLDDSKGELDRLLEEAARTGHCHSAGWRRGPNGKPIWAEVDFTPIRDVSGQLTGFTRVLHDMTARREADEALREANRALGEAEERVRLLVESVTDYAIYMLNPEGRVVTWGVGAERSLGYRSEEAIGQSHSMFFIPEDIEAGAPAMELAAAGRDGRFEAEAWRRRKDGSSFWAQVTLTAIHGPNGEPRGFAKVTRDMTRQKQFEHSLERLAADLEVRVAERTRQLESTVAELRRKNEEVEAFVYIVSHDLRAPLVNVQGFARELEESCARLKTILASSPQLAHERETVREILDEEMAGALRFISASSSKFERLIDALLGLSRQGRQVYQPVSVDVQDLVVNTVATLQQMIAEAGATVTVGSLPRVTADTTALGQVFSNLIANSIKYRSPLRPLEVEVGGETEGASVRYWVRDNGLGIPESGKSRLFQVFQRLHPKQAAGEEMGLAIAHRIVERHVGQIWAESREGQGTTFFFSLPEQSGAAPAVHKEAYANER
ncbi:MAG: PAS domain S-box protein [Terracidiphilus sp.]